MESKLRIGVGENDTKILKKEFKGKRPTIEDTCETVKEFEDEIVLENRERSTGKRTVCNPYKKLCQDHSISWDC